MLIQCQDAAFGYDGHIAVDGLNFSLEKGDYLCVAGENGSGKSTLLRGMLGLIAPLRGSVIRGEGARGTETGYLPQEAAVKKDFPAGVYEIVLSGMAAKMGLRPFYTLPEKERAEEAMRSMGVADLRRRCFRELSGGQRRRALIARALCACRGLLALDEPSAGLDPGAQAELYEMLLRLNREQGLTIVMVSHDIPAAGKYAGKILHVKNRQCFFGASVDYFNSEIGKRFLHKEEG
ncbi:MAG: ATP-binding cassette domain-containing protein [Treponema sp.]|jgi:zinc transport system ATP-binding protein|nr:ATP-binding cassette domain-containing protein [Treponema sp.]